ncbi:MAG: hypothetical protein Q9183_003812, partial [Haloplaca sp. 2 TL-2023]
MSNIHVRQLATFPRIAKAGLVAPKVSENRLFLVLATGGVTYMFARMDSRQDIREVNHDAKQIEQPIRVLCNGHMDMQKDITDIKVHGERYSSKLDELQEGTDGVAIDVKVLREKSK